MDQLLCTGEQEVVVMLDELEQHRENSSFQTQVGNGDWIYWRASLFYNWLILYRKKHKTGSWSFSLKALFFDDFALGEKTVNPCPTSLSPSATPAINT